MDAGTAKDKFSTDQAGFLMGAEFSQGVITYGGMFSLTNTGVYLAFFGLSQVDTTGVSAYAGYRQSGSGVAFALAGALAQLTSTRARLIGLSGLEQTLSSTVQGTSDQIFGEI